MKKTIKKLILVMMIVVFAFGSFSLTAADCAYMEDFDVDPSAGWQTPLFFSI